MDLEESENYISELDCDSETGSQSLSIPDALKWIDAEWHTVSRRARWMDLLGDYAGTEPFVIDGHSLIQLVINDPLLALGRLNDPSFQILHAFHILERTLDEFIKRSAVFDIVFWEETRHIALRTGASDFEETSRSLARKLLFNHLRKISQVSVYVFTGLSDPKWSEYRLLRKPMFALVNDCGMEEDQTGPFSTERLLFHRVFLYSLLTSGMALALLAGAEFRDSKVLSFVYESRSPQQNDDIPFAVRVACSAAAHVLEEQAESTALMSSSMSNGLPPTLEVLAIEDFILEMGTPTQFSGYQEKVLFFAFLIHLVLLPRLSMQSRARNPEILTFKFKRRLASDFLPIIFRAMETSITLLNTTVDIDVRVFVALVQFLAKNHTMSMHKMFGDDIASILKNKLSSFSVPISAFARFSGEFRPAPTPTCQPTNDRLGLLPFKNKIFDEVLSIYNPNDDDDTRSYPVPEVEGVDNDGMLVPKADYFDDGTLYRNARHRNNDYKMIQFPKRLGVEVPPQRNPEWQRKKELRSDQRFMKILHDQAATLTGASGATLHQIRIPPVTEASKSAQAPSKKQSYTRSTATHKQPQSKADIIRERNLAQKAEKQRVESIAWLEACIRDLDSQQLMPSPEKSLSDLKRNPKSIPPFIATELALYHLHRVLQSWIKDPDRNSGAVRDNHTVMAIRTIKGIFEMNYSTNEMRRCIQDVLSVLGFSAYTDTLIVTSTTQEDHPLTFDFVKLIKSETQEPRYAFMCIKEHPIEWQLRLFGEYMDRSMDSQPDPRVPFKPDAWQREVLDAIDDNKSLLVVAPTSAGKTFISYYAMERVLRGSDEGVIVYVAPTKALVSQVAAEVYARFHKDLQGRSCWAIYTKDYQIHDPQNCQILITVPDVLATTMLSPSLAKTWMPSLKYVILDEIHSIGQQEGGSVWEQILLLAPCPIIGLSATVGEPEKFNAWLEAVQTAGGFQHMFINYPHRYSHLRKFFYNVHKKPYKTFESISTYKSTGRMRHLHPIAMLAFGPGSIPSDLALEASDALTLYRALAAHGDVPTSALKKLKPSEFFPSARLVQQKDLIAYDTALKACLAPMMARFDPRDTTAPLYRVITNLQDGTLKRVAADVINTQPSRALFKANLLHLVCDLHAQDDLPAIFFNSDRSNCEIMATTLNDELIAKEEKWRATDPGWLQKLAQYEEWLSKAKDRERAAAKAEKYRPDPDKVKKKTVEWQATFDPKAPLSQFSFVGLRSSYTPSMLEEELEGLIRWTRTPTWAVACLRRGIAVHHAGMNKHYRTVVESLFRQGFIRVIFATDTLALGINAPTKTTVFCGDSPSLTALSYRQCAGRAGRRGYDLLGKVVFFGLPMDRVQRLVLSKLPSLCANLPVTPTLILRLFDLLDSSEYAPTAISSVKRLFRLPQVGFDSEEGKQQLLHHIRFSIDYLRRARLLDQRGRPLNLFGIAFQLHHAEPSNFALVVLLRHGVLHRICTQPSFTRAKRDFILLMSHLFGRRHLPASYLEDNNTSSSMVVLPPLPDNARRVLAAHEGETLQVFTSYALTYSSQHGPELGPDTLLPLSGVQFCGTANTGGRFVVWLQETAVRVVARSLFVANSGHDDQFESVADLVRTTRRGLNLNGQVIPSLSPIFGKAGRDRRHAKPNQHARAHGFALNAYLLDFYTHGQVKVLSDANAIRRGEVWFLLEEFASTLVKIQKGLERLIMRKPEGDDGTGGIEDEGYGEGFNNGETNRTNKPQWVAKRDWKVLGVVRGATMEFDEKFKAMWA